MDTLGTSRVPRVKNPCFCPSQNKSWSKMTKEWPKACENWCLAKFSLENLFFEEHISPDSWIFLSKWNISTLPKPNTRQQLGPKLCWTTWRNGTVLDDFYLRLISQVMMLTSWNPNQPEINGWFFLFATHESLCNKWLFHQTSLYFCLFGGRRLKFIFFLNNVQSEQTQYNNKSSEKTRVGPALSWNKEGNQKAPKTVCSQQVGHLIKQFLQCVLQTKNQFHMPLSCWDFLALWF